MGGVLIDFDQDLFVKRLGVPEADQEFLRVNIFRTLEWTLMDRGALDEAEAAERICARLPERLREPARRIICAWDDPILPMPGMEALTSELSANGYSLYLLSNASARQPSYWSNIPGSQYFSGTLISANVKLVKPQPEIYRLLCEKYSLKPEECYFVDDVPINIEGAHFIGMPGFIFNSDVSALRAALRERGVTVNA